MCETLFFSFVSWVDIIPLRNIVTLSNVIESSCIVLCVFRFLFLHLIKVRYFISICIVSLNDTASNFFVLLHLGCSKKMSFSSFVVSFLVYYSQDVSSSTSRLPAVSARSSLTCRCSSFLSFSVHSSIHSSSFCLFLDVSFSSLSLPWLLLLPLSHSPLPFSLVFRLLPLVILPPPGPSHCRELLLYRESPLPVKGPLIKKKNYCGVASLDWTLFFWVFPLAPHIHQDTPQERTPGPDQVSWGDQLSAGGPLEER